VLAVVASVLAVVLIAGGGFAAWQFLASSGQRPAEVLPDSTFALLTVDLDPSGGQKVEAIKTLRKFPSWNKRTGLSPDSDVAEAIFEEALEDGPCKALDYQDDIKPWLGSRAGVGGVLLDGKPAPVLALQVKDSELAKTGFAALVKCSQADSEESGWTVTDDYVVLSDSTEHAEAIVSAGEKAPLADSPDFQKWTEEAGGAGIVNAYVGRKSVGVLSDLAGSDLDALAGGSVLPSPQESGPEETGPGEPSEGELAEALKDFQGGAAVLQFADNGIELSFASGGATMEKDRTVGKHVAALPEDTAAVMALAVPEKALEALEGRPGATGETPFSLADIFGDDTGLDLPEDLVTLLGTSLSVSLGGDAPEDLAQVSDPADVPLGVLIHGDEAEIEAVIAKAEARAGVKLSDLPATVSSSDGKVAIATSPGYADALRGDGSLGDSQSFKDVVSHADEAQGVMYVSLQNGWIDALNDLAADEKDPDLVEALENLGALQAMGASGWNEGDVGHGLLRLALK
jgi:hypothetical protein